MKRISWLIVVFSISLLGGCYLQNLSPVGDVTQNGFGGYWKLSAYHLNGKSVPVNQILDKSLLEVQSKIVKKDSSFGNGFFSEGADYRVFSFYDDSLKKSLEIKGALSDRSYSHKSKRSTFYYKIDYYSGFLIVLDVNREAGTSSRLEMSSIIKNDTYKSELDSIHYVYVPTQKFK